MHDSKIVMNEKEASHYVGMSLSYLQHDRCYGVTGEKTPGPIFIKVGRSIRYLKSDLDEWLLKNRVSRVCQ
ncbi:MAG: DNA-binding protein [Gammaproteobacteria bacterium]|nr:DNA-binding protein [Gammaproteobacteria bacterium]